MKNLVLAKSRVSRVVRWTPAILLASLMSAQSPAAFAVPSSSSKKSSSPALSIAHNAKSAKLAAFLKAPLSFEPNLGQSNTGVRYLSRGAGYGLFLQPTEAALVLSPNGAATQQTLHMQFAGAQPDAKLAAEAPRASYSNYLLGNDPAQWHSRIPNFGKVRYTSLYPGVDAVFYGNQRKLEYDFEVAPHASPAAIALNLAGADKITALPDGALSVSLGGREVRMEAPVAYQQILGQRREVASRYTVEGTQVRFALGAYDASQLLVIDPVLSYASYLGGAGDETGLKVALDTSAVSLYVAGTTTSAVLNPAPTAGVVQNTLKGIQNVFLVKFDTSGTGIIYSTYLGSTGTDTLAGLAVDSSFNVDLDGSTNGSDFPITSATAYQTAPKASGTHIFFAQLKADGTSLLYGTYLSGSLEDDAAGLAVDGVTCTASSSTSCGAYILGRTVSTDFPVTGNVFQQNLKGNSGFVVAKIDPTKTGIASAVYVTYFGGSVPVGCVHEDGAIGVDTSQNAFVAGTTTCTDFTPVNAYQASLAGGRDAVIARFNAAGGGTTSLTYFGGSGDDSATAITVDTSTNVYVAGATGSSDLPKQTSTALIQAQPTLGDGTCSTTLDQCGDAWWAKITSPTSSTMTLLYSTYLGGAGPDQATTIAVDSTLNVFVGGFSSAANFPQSNGLGFSYAGGKDAFLARYDSSGNLQYASLYGGSADDRVTGIALDSNDIVYAVGDTTSSNIPTQLPLQSTSGGGSDGFVLKLGGSSDLQVTASTTVNPIGIGSDVTIKYVITNNGPESAVNSTFTDNIPTSGATFKSISTGQGACTTTVVSNTISCNLGVIAPVKSVTVTVVLTPLNAGTFSNSGFASVLAPAVDTNPGNNSAVASTSVVDFSISTQEPVVQTVNSGTSAAWQIQVSPGTTASPASVFPNNISIGAGVSPAQATITCVFQNVPITGPITGAVTRQVTCQTIQRPTTTTSLFNNSGIYAASWLPLGGLGFVALNLSTLRRRRKFLLLAMVLCAIALLSACSKSKTVSTIIGTPAGVYTLTFTASSGGTSHTSAATLNVN